MDSKRQSTLLSFFTKSPKIEQKQSSSSIHVMRTKQCNVDADEVECIASISNKNSKMTEESSCKAKETFLLDSPIKSSLRVKKRRAVVSSDSESDKSTEERENSKTVVKTTKSSPKRPKTDKSESMNKSSSSGTPSKFQSCDIAKSFITSFRMREDLDASIVSTSTLDRSIYKVEDETKNDQMSSNNDNENVERFPHLDFEFLKPHKIKDKQGRSPDHPEYCSRTLYVPESFIKKQTPGHQQWWKAKSDYYDTVLFFKVGKFYELFHMDAMIGVENLNLNYMRGNIAHCGFPEIGYSRFADQLVSRGYKVARVEQTETPEQLDNRKKVNNVNDKVVKREICGVTTQGTRTYGFMDGNDENIAIDSADSSPRYLCAIAEKGLHGSCSKYGVCFVDTSVGRFYIGHFEDDYNRSALRTLFARYQPSQILYERAGLSASTLTVFNSMLADKKYFGSKKEDWPPELISMLDENSVIPKYHPSYEHCLSALGAVIWYLRRCLIDVDIVSMRQFERYESKHTMEQIKAESEGLPANAEIWRSRSLVLDGLTLNNLNIVSATTNDRMQSSLLRMSTSSKYSLYNTVNRCITPSGKRLLRQWMCAPVCDPDILLSRQDAIEWLCQSSNKALIETATKHFGKILDLERLLQKIHTLGLKYRADEHPDSRAVMFETLKYNKRKINDFLQALDGFGRVHQFRKEFMKITMSEQRPKLIERCFGCYFPDIKEDLNHFKNAFDRHKAQEEGIIVPEKGVVPEYDEAVEKVEAIIELLKNYLNTIKKQLNCPSINFFGSGRSRYMLEIPESTAHTLGPEFELKSSRKGYKRMTTQKLSNLVQKLGDAESSRDEIRRDVMRRVFADFGNRNRKWAEIIERLATFDVLVSLAQYSLECGLKMCRPRFIFDAKQPFLSIKSGYHPCLATAVFGGNLGATTTVTYIPNSTSLGDNDPLTMLLTGPNMGGKSTLMRQVAVLVVLAQMGSFVPAEEMILTPVDRIFTRIGANDRIAVGQSTFYVELNETKIILQNATQHSLVLIDELGRGTCTYEGTAIAQSVLLHVALVLKCRAFFSTHYHSLCDAVKNVSNIKAAHMACMVDNENDNDPTLENVTFLYSLADGVCPKSYGFFAAKVSGISEDVVRSGFAASQRFQMMHGSIESRVAQIYNAAVANCKAKDLEEMIKLLIIP